MTSRQARVAVMNGAVESCPANSTQVAEASSRLNCGRDLYGNDQYVCAPNVEKTALVEFCYGGIMRPIPKGNCLEINKGAFVNSDCIGFVEGCPEEPYYRGNEGYKHPACQRINTDYKCYLADPSCPNITRQYTTEDSLGSSTAGVVTSYGISSTTENLGVYTTLPANGIPVAAIVGSIVGLMAMVIIGILIGIICWKKRKKRAKKIQSDDEENAVLLHTLHSTSIDQKSQNPGKEDDTGVSESEDLLNYERMKKALGDYSVWKTEISDQFSSLSDDEVCVLFCFLCSDSGTPDFTVTDWLDILNVIRQWVYGKDSVTSEESQRTLDVVKSRGFVWDQDGVHITEDVKDEIMYCVAGRITGPNRVISTTLYPVYRLSSYTTALRYLRSQGYTRKSGEKCVISYNPDCHTLLIHRLQMNILTHVTMEDTGIFDEVSQILSIPTEILQKDIGDRDQLLKNLTQTWKCVQYRGGSQGSVQHVNWLWRNGLNARPDILRSCIGLHPHCDICIINNTAYRKQSQYHDRPPAERCLLYCLLIMDDYTVKVKDESHIKVYNAIRERYFTDVPVCDEITAPENPEGIVHVENDVIKLKSDDIRRDIMYAFVTECLVEDSDLKFFLTMASRDVITEYCRSWKYRRDEGERCMYIPRSPGEMYELFIDRLQLDILTHCTVSDRGIHGSISKRLGIPWEIVRWDDAARSRYAEVAKKGTQTIHRARAMIVGCAGAGKSTLIKRLQKRSLDELKKVLSTVGLEIHEDIFEIAPDSGRLKDLIADTNKEGKQILSILDFGGQCAYYACHQVYLSRRAFYLLVLNMAKGFDEKVDPALCEQEGTMFTDWTYGEYMLFWLKSVHTYCDNDAPVIIVGTHLDQTNGQDRDTLYYSILDCIQDDKHLKQHLARERCFVLGFKSDDSSFEDTLFELEKCIVSIAMQDRWKESIPTDWALTEVVLRKLREQRKRMISVTELSRKCFDKNKEKYTQINDILKFYHDIGAILHFDESSLADIVIVDIQWFVDCFKNIITDPNHARDLVRNKGEWLAFNENGQIQDSLLTNIWSSRQFEINSDDKDNLLKYMERLGLIYIGREAHFIPCMNKRAFTTEQKNKLQTFPSQTSVLVFRFPFLPYFIYFRLIVACLTKTNGEWRFPKDKELSLYKNLACFLCKSHTVVIAVNKYSVQLQVFHPSNVSIPQTVTLEIRADIEKLLRGLTSNFHKEIVYTVGYQCSQQDVFREHDDCFVEEKDIQGKGKQTCPIHELSNFHTLSESDLLYHWNKDVLGKPTITGAKETDLSERDLLKFNNAVGKDIVVIATSLQLSGVEIERSIMENSNSARNAVHSILLKWKSKHGRAATLENLEKSLQEVERDTGASVDWGVFNQTKEAILKERK